MSEPINQHYLPQFYLKSFTDLNTGLLQVFQSGDLGWKGRGVKKVASAQHLYSYQDKQGVLRYDIEAMFSQLEKEFSLVLAKIINRQALAKAEELTFACFIMVMWHKVPAQVNQVNAFQSEAIQCMLEMLYYHYSKNPEALELQKEQIRLKTGEDAFAVLRPEHLNPSKWKIKYNGHKTLTEMMLSATRLGEVVCKMGWTFFVSNPSDSFITSDNPFSIYDPTDTVPYCGAGLGNEHAEICFPLSRNIAFFADWKNQRRCWLTASEQVVERINIRTARKATRELIALNREFPGSNKPLAPFYRFMQEGD